MNDQTRTHTQHISMYILYLRIFMMSFSFLLRTLTRLVYSCCWCYKYFCSLLKSIPATLFHTHEETPHIYNRTGNANCLLFVSITMCVFVCCRCFFRTTINSQIKSHHFSRLEANGTKTLILSFHNYLVN